YRARGFKEGMFPVAERVGRQIVSLPMFYAMNEVDVERVCAALSEELGIRQGGDFKHSDNGRL
ncbi:MAG: DegT/DnrJ/EryC1/StrS family aminotransferase, partial [Gallionella sp.]